MGDSVYKFEPIAVESAEILKDRIQQLRDLFPEAFTEGKIDWDRLRATLGESVDECSERYSFSWAGKRDAIRLLQIPSRATLIPAKGESVNFEVTRNLFIEGDNFEVLKLLYKSYFGCVKLIYIDPPYNTGNDFIYPDNYTNPLETYLELTGQRDSEGNLLTSNPETSGRYHSDWLSMMYPRLFLARQLLRNDGVIFVSIDDHEVHNLKMIMNEVFGEENFIAQLVWEKGRKNDAKLFSVGHEYLLVYTHSLDFLKQKGTVWREPKPGAQEIWEEYCGLRQRFGDDDQAVEKALQQWYQSLPEKHPSKALSRYKHVDKYGPWRDRDISWPGGGGPQYEVIHPVTQQPCKVPDAGWRFSSPESMQKQIQMGLVVFREDHAQPPFRKAHLRPISEELSDDNEAILNGEDDDENTAVGLQVMPSVIYKQSQVAVKYLRGLMSEKIFDNPKDHEVLARLIRYCAVPDNNDIILDFFAGSCSTAQAVLKLNHEDRGNRRFIMVQLPETTKNSRYQTIAEIGKERIRRIINRMIQETKGELNFQDREEPEDLGFKVFKLAESNFKQWIGFEGDDPESYTKQLSLDLDPLENDWTVENVVYEVALKEGYGLNSKINKVQGLKCGEVYTVTDPDKDQYFYICLDDRFDLGMLKPLGLTKDDLFICRDRALTDETAANLALQCRVKTL